MGKGEEELAVVKAAVQSLADKRWVPALLDVFYRQCCCRRVNNSSVSDIFRKTTFKPMSRS